MKHDVIVIGAGPVGLSFANSLARLGLNITLVEKQQESVIADPAYDGREIALTHHSKHIMEENGSWEKLGDKNISLIRHARVVNGNSPYALHFDHSEAGEENLGFMASNHHIRRAAYQSSIEHKNINLFCNTEVTGVETNDAQGTVTLKDSKKLTAPFIVAADSRFSPARKMMDIPVSTLDFKRTCIVTKMKIGGTHDDTAWECFHYDRTLAVLPLNNNYVSVVITLDTAIKDTLLDMSDDEFGADMESRTEGRYGKMALSEKLYSYPLMAVYARRFYARRFALLGDAAVGMHPVTAHGFNLGLRGQDTLAREIADMLKTGGDIGASYALERYNRKHRATSKPIYEGTNALVRLYTRTSPPAKLARRALLRLGNVISPAKQLITNQLTESNG